MICEPNFSLPHKIDLYAQGEMLQPYHVAQQEEMEIMGLQQATKMRRMQKVQPDYNVLPLMAVENDYLKAMVSIRKNPYLKCRWHQFLDKRPTKQLTIKLYPDFADERRKNLNLPNHRFHLTGAYYGRDNKLQPIPVAAYICQQKCRDPQAHHPHQNAGAPVNHGAKRSNAPLSAPVPTTTSCTPPVPIPPAHPPHTCCSHAHPTQTHNGNPDTNLVASPNIQHRAAVSGVTGVLPIGHLFPRFTCNSRQK